jgi:hypothetical protein
VFSRAGHRARGTRGGTATDGVTVVGSVHGLHSQLDGDVEVVPDKVSTMDADRGEGSTVRQLGGGETTVSQLQRWLR